MKKHLLLFTLSLFFGLHIQILAQSPYQVSLGERPFIDIKKVPESAYHQGHLLIKIKPEYATRITAAPLMEIGSSDLKFGLPALDALTKQTGVQQVKQYFYSPALDNRFSERHKAWGLHLWYEMIFDSRSSVVEVVQQFRQLNEIEVAEPVYKKKRIADVANPQGANPADDEGGKSVNWTPNDPRFSEQWHYHNTGQQSGTVDKDIDLPEAWEIEKGKPNVIVAVIDGGIQINHPDLAANIWSGVGYNFVDGNTTITPDDHGTHVAGTIAAVNNNAVGVAGIAGGSGSGDGVRLMSCQVFKGTSAQGGFSTAPIWAADKGASISQNSWGYGSVGVFNQAELIAIDYFNAYGGGDALDGGITIFAAGNDNASGLWYPGCYSGAFSVAGTNNKDQKSWYSNYDDWVDISAPGGETNSVTERGVLSTLKNSTYGFYQGTSMACPHVSGVAALVVSHAYGNITSAELKNILTTSVDDHYGVNPSYVGKLGSGRINAYLAVLASDALVSGVLNPPTFTAAASSVSQINLAWTKNANNNDVMVVWASSGSFGTPVSGTSYSVGQSLPGGGTVLYKGSATEFVHSSLSANTKYFYKAFSYNASNEYSSGKTANASTFCSVYLPPLAESFGSGTLPNCWEITDNNSSGQTWTIGSITGYTSTYLPSLTAPYAYLNSDAYGSGKSQNSDLITPVLDLSGSSSVNLSFQHYYRHYAGSAVTLSYSVNGGSSWTAIQSWSANSANPATFNQTIAAVAGKSQVRFKWNYTGSWGYYWAVDNISVTTSGGATLSVTPANQDVTTAAGATTFNVSSNTSWTATSNQAWCAVTPSGNNNGTITATYSANSSSSPRVATISVSASGAPTQNVTVTQAGVVLTPVAQIVLRPQQIDLSTANSLSAVLVSVSNYPSDDAKYRLYNGSNQYNCWDGSQFVSSNSYTANPSIPGTPSTNSTWWVMFERGSNNSETANYRDRLGPSYGSNYQTASLPTANAITNPVNISGTLPLTNASYPFDQRYVVLAYDAVSGGTLISATSSGLSTGAFTVVVEDGTVIQRLEVRNQLNVLMEQATGSWPTVDPIAIFNLSGGGAYCDNGLPSNISATLSGSEAGVSYQLYQNGNLYLSPIAGTGNSLSWSNLTAGTYTAKATKDATTVDMSGSVLVTAQSPLNASVSFTASQNPVCQGTEVTFNALAVNGGTSPVFVWSVNGIAAGENSSTFNYIPANGDVVGLAMTSSESCVAVNPVNAVPVTMTVNPTVTASVTITANANPVCSGTSVNFTAQPTNGGTLPAYQWKVNSQNVGSNSNSFSYIPANGDHVEVVLTSNLACVSNNPVISNTVVMQVSTSVNASVEINISNSSPCQGQSVNLTAVSNNGGSNPVFEWFVNGNAVGTNSTSYSFIPQNGDQVQLKMTPSLACVVNNPALSNVLTINVAPVQLNLVASPANSGNLNMSGSAVIGQALQVSAVAASGFTFVNWKNSLGQIVSSSPSFAYMVINCQETLTAHFVEAQPTSISGKIVFFNETESALESPYVNGSFFVQLYDGNQAVGQPQAVQTNTPFVFNNVEANKQYRLKLWDQPDVDVLQHSWSWSNWGGGSALDALIVSFMSSQNPVIQEFPWIATQAEPQPSVFATSLADINQSGTLSALDALLIMYRSVGMPDALPFPGGKPNFLTFAQKVPNLNAPTYPGKPEIAFETHGSYNASSAASAVYQIASLPPAENGSNYFKLYYVPVGDLNASFMEVQNKSQTYYTTVEYDGNPSQLPILLSSHLKLGAFNLSLQYDPDLIEVKGLPGYQVVNNNEAEGLLSVAFMDENGREFQAGEPLMLIEVAYKREPKPGEVVFKPVGQSIWADNNANVLPFVELAVPGAKTPDLGAINQNEAEVSAYPNPFAHKTTINIWVPEAADVQLKIFNSLGMKIAARQWQQAKGSKQVEIDSHMLRGKGIYYYEAIISSPSKTSIKRGSLIFAN